MKNNELVVSFTNLSNIISQISPGRLQCFRSKILVYTTNPRVWLPVIVCGLRCISHLRNQFKSNFLLAWWEITDKSLSKTFAYKTAYLKRQMNFHLSIMEPINSLEYFKLHKWGLTCSQTEGSCRYERLSKQTLILALGKIWKRWTLGPDHAFAAQPGECPFR